MHPLFTLSDRRAPGRAPDPWCPACHDAAVAFVRTSMVVYYQCVACGQLWGEPKPNAPATIHAALERRHHE